MVDQIFELQYAIDTFYFLVCGALVMWMAAGFSMLESGLVRSKNTAEILTKNVALYSIACIMYMVCGYMIMYDGALFLSGIAGGESLVDDVLLLLQKTDSTGILYMPLHQISFSRWCLLPRPCRSYPAQLLSE